MLVMERVLAQLETQLEKSGLYYVEKQNWT